jgi:hypothetical protein
MPAAKKYVEKRIDHEKFPLSSEAEANFSHRRRESIRASTPVPDPTGCICNRFPCRAKLHNNRYVFFLSIRRKMEHFTGQAGGPSGEC